MRTTGTADRVRRARTNQPKLEVVVGFDSEWVDASHADDGIPPNTSNRNLECPPSALVGQIRQIEEGSVSGSS